MCESFWLITAGSYGRATQLTEMLPKLVIVATKAFEASAYDNNNGGTLARFGPDASGRYPARLLHFNPLSFRRSGISFNGLEMT